MKYFDRVKETATTTGTGDFTLAGAATGFRTFASVLSTNDTCYYCIALQGGSEWEVGLGTYSGTNTLTRTIVLSSSNSGSAVNFSSGTKDVFLTVAAEQFSTVTGQCERSAGNLTTTSTSFVDVDATNLSLTMTTRARRCRVTVLAVGYILAANTLCLDITVDSTRQGDNLGLVFTNSTIPVPLCFSYITGVLSAGSHTFRLQWKVTGSTGNLYAATTASKIRMIIEELPLYA